MFIKKVRHIDYEYKNEEIKEIYTAKYAKLVSLSFRCMSDFSVLFFFFSYFPSVLQIFLFNANIFKISIVFQKFKLCFDR